LDELEQRRQLDRGLLLGLQERSPAPRPSTIWYSAAVSEPVANRTIGFVAVVVAELTIPKATFRKSGLKTIAGLADECSRPKGSGDPTALASDLASHYPLR
jgi:hypothetical protein